MERRGIGNARCLASRLSAWMKIAVVTPEYPPDTIGGGGVAVEALVHEFAGRHDVRVFSAADSIRSWFQGRHLDPTADAVVNRYPLIPVGRRKPYLRSVVPPDLPAWLGLRKDLMSWRPDVAHLHGYGYAVTDLAGRILVRRGVPYIITIHGLPTTPLARNSLIRAAYRAYQRFGVGSTVRRARVVTAVSKSVADSVPCPVKVRVVPNGVTPLPVSDPARAGLLRGRLGISDGTPMVAAAGRLSTSKGFDVLVRALDDVRVPKLACVIAGSDAGAERLLLELAAHTRPGVSVRLVGRLSREDLADLFSAATVIVVPSREEPFGLVALEALSVRRRLVASNTGGLSEFLHARVAELVPPGDAAVLASAITSSLLRGRFTPREQKEVDELLDQHSWATVACQYESLLGEVANV